MQISYETKWGQSGISNRFFQKFTNYKSSHDNVSTFVQMICGICKFQAYRPLGSRACHGTPDFGRLCPPNDTDTPGFLDFLRP